MKLSYGAKAIYVTTLSMMGLVIGSCASSQPDFECSSVNRNVYQLRYYKDEANSTCTKDSGTITGALIGGTAGIETYMLLTPDGGGGPDVYFVNTTNKLDRSATKIALRLETLLSAVVVKACDDNLLNNCAEPDPTFDSTNVCKYCLTVVSDGGAGTSYILPDGSNGEDTVLLPDGGKQGVQKSTADGGMKRISLSNACDPGKKENVVRKTDPTPDPNLFLTLPRYGKNGICTPIDVGDGGVTATSKAVFPEKTCQDLTKLDAVEITTTLSNYRLLSSARIPGLVAKAQVTFEEKAGSNSCKNIYQVVFLTPQVECKTDLDCSPDPVKAPVCTGEVKPSDFCLGGSVTNSLQGSGLSPFLFSVLSDGGYDLKDKCDPDLGYCIWNIDAGGI